MKRVVRIGMSRIAGVAAGVLSTCAALAVEPADVRLAGDLRVTVTATANGAPARDATRSGPRKCRGTNERQREPPGFQSPSGLPGPRESAGRSPGAECTVKGALDAASLVVREGRATAIRSRRARTTRPTWTGAPSDACRRTDQGRPAGLHQLQVRQAAPRLRRADADGRIVLSAASHTWPCAGQPDFRRRDAPGQHFISGPIPG